MRRLLSVDPTQALVLFTSPEGNEITAVVARERSQRAYEAALAAFIMEVERRTDTALTPNATA
jgi:hypothetical protein